MTRTRLTAALVVTGVLVAAGFVQVAEAESAYRVIVHNQVKGSQIPRATLSSIFLRQAPRWGDGSPVQPVDQSMRSRIRQSFTADVMQQLSMVEMQVFWSRKMATGVTPPPVKQTDDEVAAYVASTPGAIGYVSPATPLPQGVREIAIVQ